MGREAVRVDAAVGADEDGNGLALLDRVRASDGLASRIDPDHLEWLRSRLSVLLVVGEGPFEVPVAQAREAWQTTLPAVLG